MMHFLPVSLLAILAGTLLLIKIKKDGLGRFFTFISWFFIVVGFILFIGFMVGGICRLTHCGKAGHAAGCQEMMMKGCNPGMKMGLSCPPYRYEKFCGKNPNCIRNDSSMKSCCRHMENDTSGMECQKHK